MKPAAGNSNTATTPLERIIAGMIDADGPMPLDRYMDLCLGHPEAGYYMTRDPFGRDGDFVTAPEVSQMFGELIGLWCAHVWTTMDAPQQFTFVELGPGRGTLMADMLRAGSKVRGFCEAASIALVETSPLLRQIQAEKLSAFGQATGWHDHLDLVPDGPAIIVANEFLDALPVRQFERTERGWFERMVGRAEDGRLKLGLMPSPVPSAQVPPHAVGAPPGSIYETSCVVTGVISQIAGRLRRFGGAALMIDYGHTESGLGETLQAVRAHAFADILDRPGESDLTAHVDFSEVARAATDSGTAVHGPVTQGEYLEALGIGTRAEILKTGLSADRRAEIDTDLERLTATDQMGEMFKVMAITSPDLPPPPLGAD